MSKKALLVLLLAAAMLLGLSGCGRTRDELHAGSYEGVWVEYHGVAFSIEELFEEGLTLQLDSDGGGKLLAGGEEGEISWTLSGNALSLDIAGDLSEGSLEDGVIRLDLLNQGILVTLVKEGVSLPEEEPDAGALALREALQGDWYGWWRVENSEGTLPDMWYDGFASFGEDARGRLTMSFWDEGSGREDLLGLARLSLSGGEAVSEAGWFWFADLKEGDWRFTVEDDRLTVSGHHDAEGEVFDYTICLRPWGDLWENAEAEELPFYFESWYLPLIKAGEAMPDTLALAEN